MLLSHGPHSALKSLVCPVDWKPHQLAELQQDAENSTAGFNPRLILKHRPNSIRVLGFVACFWHLVREGNKVPCNLEDCSCAMASTVIKKDVSTGPSRQQPEQFGDTFRKNSARCRILTTAKLTDKWHLAQTSCCRARQPLAAGRKLLGYILHTSRKQGAFPLQSVTPAAYRKMHVEFLKCYLSDLGLVSVLPIAGLRRSVSSGEILT